MVLAVNTSKKAILGVTTTLAALGVVTILFYRYRGDATAQQNTLSLAGKDVSFWRNIPLIGSAINYFNPIVVGKKPMLPIRQVGNSSSLIPSVYVLTTRLKVERQNYQALTALIIYGDNLELIEDPGILALNPQKLILVGACIVESNQSTSLWQLMKCKGWFLYKGDVSIVKVKSVNEALKATNAINAKTQQPYFTAYIVEG